MHGVGGGTHATKSNISPQGKVSVHVIYPFGASNINVLFVAK